jgi:hypothetical protein
VNIIRSARWRGIELGADDGGRTLRGRKGALLVECFPSHLSASWDIHLRVECKLTRAHGAIEITKPVWATARDHDLERALETGWQRLEAMVADLSLGLEVALRTVETIAQLKRERFSYQSSIARRERRAE